MSKVGKGDIFMRYPEGERPAIHSYKRKTLQPNDYRVIAALKAWGADKDYIHLKQTIIAAMTGMQQSKVSKTIDRLVFKGFVNRFRVSYKQDALILLKYHPLLEDRINKRFSLKAV
jgi:DNA-binding MarR family transcriptional regulator